MQQCCTASRKRRSSRVYIAATMALCVHLQAFADGSRPGYETSHSEAPVQSAEQAAVERVNAHFNGLKRLSDERVWRRADHWATSDELLRAGGGDCEDLAAAKYFALRELGVPVQRMRLVYARLFDGRRLRVEAHVVLWYRPDAQADWIVLDSLRPEITPMRARHDLLPRLVFNEAQVARWDAGGREIVLGDTRLFDVWHDLLARQRMLDSVARVLRIHQL